MNVWLLSAGLSTAGLCAVHASIGGSSVARPLLAATDLGAVPTWTQYYCWHVVTITLAAMALGLGYAAVAPDARDAALLIGSLAAAFALFGLWLPMRAGTQRYLTSRGPLGRGSRPSV